MFFEHKNVLIWSLFTSLPRIRLLSTSPNSLLTRSRFVQATAPTTHLKHLALHLRFVSTLASTQLVEYFTTHLQKSFFLSLSVLFTLPKLTTSLFCSFLVPTVTFRTPAQLLVGSIDFIFDAAWWLERESAEGTGLELLNKEDIRNLLLEYSNVFKPLLRLFPSFGFFEIAYNSLLRLLELRHLGLQQV